MAKKPRKKDPKLPKAPKNKEEKSSIAPRYPNWARFVVCIFLLAWLAGLAFFTGTVQSSVTMMRQAFDPEFISATLAKVAKIDKLPEGFKPQLAAAFMNVSMVTLLHKPDDTAIMFWFLPPEKRRYTAKELADNMAERGIPTISDEFTIDKRGTIPVAGETLSYVTGVAEDKQGHDFGGFIGCSVLKDDRAFLVYGWTPEKETGAATTDTATTGNPTTSTNTTGASAAGTATTGAVTAGTATAGTATAGTATAGTATTGTATKGAATTGTATAGTAIAGTTTKGATTTGAATATAGTGTATAGTASTGSGTSGGSSTGGTSSAAASRTTFNMSALNELLASIKSF